MRMLLGSPVRIPLLTVVIASLVLRARRAAPPLRHDSTRGDQANNDDAKLRRVCRFGNLLEGNMDLLDLAFGLRLRLIRYYPVRNSRTNTFPLTQVDRFMPST